MKSWHNSKHFVWQYFGRRTLTTGRILQFVQYAIHQFLLYMTIHIQSLLYIFIATHLGISFLSHLPPRTIHHGFYPPWHVAQWTHHLPPYAVFWVTGFCCQCTNLSGPNSQSDATFPCFIRKREPQTAQNMNYSTEQGWPKSYCSDIREVLS